MASGNCVRNTQLSSMLKAAERAQTERLGRSLRTFQERRHSEQATPGPEKAKPSQEEKGNTVTPVATPAPAGDPEKKLTETIPLTLDEIEWLDDVVERNRLLGFSGVFGCLVNWANSEPSEAKKKLFLVIRCRRCSAGAKGGVKRDRDIELSSRHWQWLENVRTRCNHASVGKTLRIIVDFYMPLCKEDIEFERKVLGAGSALGGDTPESHHTAKSAISISSPCNGGA